MKELNPLTTKSLKDLKVAIVTDWMFGSGGADRFIQTIQMSVPNSTIYTSIYIKENYENTWFDTSQEVKETFMGKFPFKKYLYKYFSIFLPYAFEYLDLKDYDLVISVSAGQSKGVITDVYQPHYGIILTPPRFIWDDELNVRGMFLHRVYKFAATFVRMWLKAWDKVAIKRVDRVATISKYVQKFAKRVYGVDSDILYPGIREWWLEQLSSNPYPDIELPEKYFVYVGRLFDYKRIDWAIEAVNNIGGNLIIAGEGPDSKTLKQLADESPNIQILDRPSDEQSKSLFTNAQAFIFPGVEDFGLLPIECLASGTPVIAYNKGGLTETIEAGKSGEFFSSIDELTEILGDFDKSKYAENLLKERASKFTEKETNKTLDKLLTEFLHDFYN
jgi:glycosyltransferase involved in cell wall biosynthesis